MTQNMITSKYCFLSIFCLIISAFSLHAQEAPAEGAILNYRIVGFKGLPASSGKNKIEIAEGTCINEDSFKHKILSTTPYSGDKVIIEIPKFGCSYTWRTVKSSGTKSKFYHFSTGYSKNIDTNTLRLRITKPAEKFKNAYVFSDHNRALYDMKGRPVWYLPVVPGLVTETSYVRNLRISSAGTITFLAENLPCEIDFDGHLLWSGPRNNSTTNDSLENYHHEFKRLENGNYMAMGTESCWGEWKILPNGDSAFSLTKKPADADNTEGKIFPLKLNTILEFNKDKKLIWSWKTSDHFSAIDGSKPTIENGTLDNHENSFYYNEKKGFIYISCRNLSEIIKIKYPSGEIENVYSNKSAPDPLLNTQEGNVLFANQHSCKVSDKGYIYLFSNNLNTPESIPGIVRLKEPETRDGKLQKIWEYCYPVSLFQSSTGMVMPMPNMPNGPRKQPVKTNGGNVIELPDQSIFVSMCHPFGNVYIVDVNKNIVWDAILERYMPMERRWMEIDQYRGSIISNSRHFEQLVLGGK